MSLDHCRAGELRGPGGVRQRALGCECGGVCVAATARVLEGGTAVVATSLIARVGGRRTMSRGTGGGFICGDRQFHGQVRQGCQSQQDNEENAGATTHQGEV